MIKIIKKGTKQTQTCGECGCLFSHDEEDIVVERDVTFGFRRFVVCPQCENRVNVSAEKTERKIEND